MSKKQNTDFYNKASFGFYICLQPKEVKKKLSRDTLFIASEIGNYLAYKCKSNQNTYKGTISEFCEVVSTELVVKAVNELTKAGFIVKSIDDKLSLAEGFLKFKKEMEFLIEEKKLSKGCNKKEKDKFELYFKSKNELRDWGRKIEFLDYMVNEECEKNYQNFHSGFYKVLLREMITPSQESNSFRKQMLSARYSDLKDDILRVYFPDMEGNLKYQNKEYMKAKEHMDFFTNKLMNGDRYENQ